MKVGEKVRWRCVNGIAEGVVEEKFDDKFWWVRLPNGKYMLLNDNNIIKEENNV